MSGSLDPRSIARIALHMLLTFAVLAPSLRVARDHQPAVSDLVQDCTSARSWLDGDSAYCPLAELHVRYGFEPPRPHVQVRYNPHPPVAVLLTVPFARVDFETALSGVQWTQLLALALTWAL